MYQTPSPLESLAAYAICFVAGVLTSSAVGAYVDRVKRQVREG